jgi:hypothetical protein
MPYNPLKNNKKKKKNSKDDNLNWNNIKA